MKELGLYKNILLFWNGECIKNPNLRKNTSVMGNLRHKLNDHLTGVDVKKDIGQNKVDLKLKLDIRKAKEANE